MLKNKKKLSIIIPSYNEINNLKILLNKANEILSKNKNIEIIIVDNGSTDGSKNYLYDNKKFFPKIKVVRVKKILVMVLASNMDLNLQLEKLFLGHMPIYNSILRM